jgi:DNA replication ATP-dependent helicase Dna2
MSIFLAYQLDYGVSMLKRLAEGHPDSVSQLTYQYRMNEEICQLSNDIVYNGKLKCANDIVAKQRLTLDGYPQAVDHLINNTSLPWMRKALDPSNAVVFLDTDAITLSSSDSSNDVVHPLESSSSRRSGGSIVNETEAFIANILAEGLIRCGLDASLIGIISPFRAQLRILNEKESINSWKKNGLEVSTIDRFQGRDKSVIILSFVRSNAKGKVGHLLEDFRRMNVAVTRAKYKLIMVGSYSTLYSGSGVLKSVLDRVSNYNSLIKLPANTSLPSSVTT